MSDQWGPPHFKCVREDKEPRTSGKDSMEDQRIFEAIMKAGIYGREVPLKGR